MTNFAPDWTNLRDYIGASDDKEQSLSAAVNVATALVNDVVLQAWRAVPQAVYTQVVLDTAYAVYKRSAAPNASLQYAFEGAVPMSEANDPMRKSWTLLRRYVSAW